MAIATPNHRLTAAEYLEIERHAETKSEFFGGEMFAMAGGSVAHNQITTNLNRALGNRLAGKHGLAFFSDLRLHVEASGLYTYPDMMVICGPPQLADQRRDTVLNPTLIGEVLSESTQHYDRGAKFGFYRQVPSLREFLLISQWEPKIEQYHLESDNNWRLRDVVGLGDQLALNSVSIIIPLAEIYAHVEFPVELPQPLFPKP